MTSSNTITNQYSAEFYYQYPNSNLYSTSNANNPNIALNNSNYNSLVPSTKNQNVPVSVGIPQQQVTQQLKLQKNLAKLKEISSIGVGPKHSDHNLTFNGILNSGDG